MENGQEQRQPKEIGVLFEGGFFRIYAGSLWDLELCIERLQRHVIEQKQKVHFQPAPPQQEEVLIDIGDE